MLGYGLQVVKGEFPFHIVTNNLRVHLSRSLLGVPNSVFPCLTSSPGGVRNVFILCQERQRSKAFKQLIKNISYVERKLHAKLMMDDAHVHIYILKGRNPQFLSSH